MSRVRVKYNYPGFYKLRSDPNVIRELERRGRAILDYANRTMPNGYGYRMSSFQGAKKDKGRWFVQVYAASNHAKYSNAKHQTLVNALNATQNPTPPAVDPGGHP